MRVVHDPDGDALRLVAEEVRAAVRGCETAAVTAVVGDQPVIVVGTDPVGRRLEEAQWSTGRGPGIDAMRQLQVFNVASLASAPSWPEFARVALGHGVHRTLAVPVTARGRALGVLDLYASDPGAFTGWEPVAIRHASRAATLLAGAAWMDAVRPPASPPGAAGGPAVMPAVS